jgi:hypothetical protein
MAHARVVAGERESRARLSREPAERRQIMHAIRWLFELTKGRAALLGPVRPRHRRRRRWVARSAAFAAFAAGGLVLDGCSLLPGGDKAQAALDTVVNTGIKDRQHYNDEKAGVLPALTCDISVGAYARMAESNVKRGVGLICGLDNGQAVASDLTAATEIIRALTQMRAAAQP